MLKLVHSKPSRVNPYVRDFPPLEIREMAADAQVDYLRSKASTLFGIDIREHCDIKAFTAFAPDWPGGQWKVRIPRLRRDRSTLGLRATYNMHLTIAKSVFLEGFYEDPLAKVETLEYADRKETHRPGLEWRIVDLLDDRVSDDALTALWMFPDILMALAALREDYALPGYAFRANSGYASKCPAIAFTDFDGLSVYTRQRVY